MLIYGGFDLDTYICFPAMLNIDEKELLDAMCQTWCKA